jgi:hypothetical protein
MLAKVPLTVLSFVALAGVPYWKASFQPNWRLANGTIDYRVLLIAG